MCCTIHDYTEIADRSAEMQMSHKARGVACKLDQPTAWARLDVTQALHVRTLGCSQVALGVSSMFRLPARKRQMDSL
jgi:hypothetical protein